MDSSATQLRPSQSANSLSSTSLSETTSTPADRPNNASTATPELLVAANLIPRPEPFRPRAETATSGDLRAAFFAPEDRLMRINEDIHSLLEQSEDSSLPRLPEGVYDGLRRCANEMQTILTYVSEPHIMQTDGPDEDLFQPEPARLDLFQPTDSAKPTKPTDTH